MAHTELGKDVLMKLATELEEVAQIESAPKLEGRTMTMILAPKNKEELLCQNKKHIRQQAKY